MWTPPGIPKSLLFIGTQLWGLADVILAVEGAEKNPQHFFWSFFILKTSKHKVGFIDRFLKTSMASWKSPFWIGNTSSNGGFSCHVCFRLGLGFWKIGTIFSQVPMLNLTDCTVGFCIVLLVTTSTLYLNVIEAGPAIRSSECWSNCWLPLIKRQLGDR